MVKDIIRAHRSILLICIAISLALYMTAAWKSAIYLHPDEYYQIVEFASYKMHITAPDQMAWEFGEKIRPAFQPLMCYSLLKTFNALSVSDHYTQLYLLRVLSALFSLFSITLFCISSLSFINEKYRKIFIAANFLFWYPYTYGVHFSSETWSGCLTLISVSLTIHYYQQENRKPLRFFSALGLLMGAAFLIRFQTAFISLGILAWLFFEKKERANLVAVISTGILMLAVGTVIDHWFYGEWICVPWRYFDSAFIHKYTEFGSKPFYFYPLFIPLMLTPPIGLAIVIALIIFFFTHPRTIYTWALLPFLLFHTIIGHKEFRFIYPVISFFPLVLVMAWQGLRSRKFHIPRWLSIPGLSVAAIFNILCIVIFVFFADKFLFDSKIFCQEIHEIAQKKKVIVYCNDSNDSPYILPKATIPQDLTPIYMMDANVTNVLMTDLSNVLPSHGSDTSQLIVTRLYAPYDHPMPQLTSFRAQTLMNLSKLRPIVGEDVYRVIEENTYYLFEL